MSDHTKINQQNKQQDQKRQEQSHENSSAMQSFAPPDSAIQPITDNRPCTVAQRRLQELMDKSPQVQAGAQLQSMIDNSPRQVAQRKALKSIFGGDTAPVQRKTEEEEQTIQAKENNTGLPDNLKTGVENLSGMSMDDVKVHYSSARPRQLNALAYAQGNDIHLGPGQEKHLPHEAWHVVQQRQGRVQATMQMKGVGVNDEDGLEKEADLMGEKAVAANENPDSQKKSVPKAKSDYRAKVENSEEYKNFIPNEGKLSVMDKWTQFHCQGYTEYVPDLEEYVHICGDNNNTYTSLSIQYKIPLQSLMNLNQVLIKQYGNFIPVGSKVFVFSRANVLDEFPQHLIYEFAAHHLVYKEAYTPFNKEELEILNKAGYNNQNKFIKWKTGDIGFQAVLIPSNRPEGNWLLAIRGTNPGYKSSDLLTIVTDTDPKAIGASQFAANKGIIEQELLTLCPGKVDVVGHSLGGAMAQHVAANFPGKVANVVTFQAPGIDHDSVNKFLKLPENERPQSIHHFMKGDQVDKAGDAKLPGLNVEHDFGIKQILPSEILATTKLRLTGIKQGVVEFDKDFREAAMLPAQLLGFPTHSPGSVFEAIEMLTANIPTLGNIEKKGVILKKMAGKIQELQADIGKAFTNGSQFLNFIAELIAAEGEAHSKRVFSSSDFIQHRDKAGISDEFMGRPTDDTLRKKGEKNPTGGMQISKDNMNEKSSQIRNDGDAYSSERLIAENFRSAIGKGRDKVLTMKQIIAITEAVEKIVETIKVIMETIQKLKESLNSFNTPDLKDLETLKGYLEKLWNQLEKVTLHI